MARGSGSRPGRGVVVVLPKNQVPVVLEKSLDATANKRNGVELDLPQNIILQIMKWYHDRGVLEVPEKKLEASYNKVMAQMAADLEEVENVEST